MMFLIYNNFMNFVKVKKNILTKLSETFLLDIATNDQAYNGEKNIGEDQYAQVEHTWRRNFANE